VKLVLDASVVVAWLFADDPSEVDGPVVTELFTALAASRFEAIQPVHWLAEVSAVATRRDAARARACLSKLWRLDLGIWARQEIYLLAIEVAAKTKTHVFDSLYHAVALQNSATLVTSDQKYFAAAQAEGQIALLHQFKL